MLKEFLCSVRPEAPPGSDAVFISPGRDRQNNPEAEPLKALTLVLAAQLLFCLRQGLRTMLTLNSRSFCHARATGTGYRLALAPQVLPEAW